MRNQKLAELLHQYFELGVAEGREGRKHDTEAGDAQRVLSEIEAEIAALSAAEPVAWGNFKGDGTLVGLSEERPDSWTGAKPLYAAPLSPSVAVKALKPFATDADIYDGQDIADGEKSFNDNITVGDLRRARNAYSALSAQVQGVAGLKRLRDVTFAVQHNPNCPAKYLVRLVGKSGRIDLKPYAQANSPVKHETGDILGFGKTIDEAIDAALAAAAPAKQEG